MDINVQFVQIFQGVDHQRSTRFIIDDVSMRFHLFYEEARGQQAQPNASEQLNDVLQNAHSALCR